MENKENNFELEIITESNGLCIKDFDKQIKAVNEILENYKVFAIQNDSDKKIAKEIRASLNKCVNAISRNRIDFIKDYTCDLESQSAILTSLFKERIAEFDSEIKGYEDSQNLVNGVSGKTHTYTATIKFSDEKFAADLVKFCSERNVTDLKIK